MADARLSAEPQFVQQVAWKLDNVHAPEWLIKWLVERGTVGQIYAGWNIGKSALAVDIACRVAAGLTVAGLKTHRGAVLYIAQEGVHGILRRFKAWQTYHGINVPDCIFQTVAPVRLPSEEIEAQLDEARAYIEAEFGPLVLAVLDTASATMVGDQKHGKDMNDYLSALYRVFSGVTVMLLHHVGHLDKSRARGASELPAACDWEFRLDTIEESEKVIRMRNTKQRDADLHRDIYFQLTPVTLGVDDDGDDYGSIVAEYLPSYEPSEEPARGPSPTGTTMLAVLSKLTNDHRQRLVDGKLDPADARVRTDDWRQACQQAGINPSTYRNNKRTLQDKGLIEFDGPYVSQTGA